MFSQNSIVIIFDNNNEPLMLAKVEKKLSAYVMVNGVRFSSRTGEIMSTQSESFKEHFNDRHAAFSNLHGKSFDEISSRIELFDESRLDTVSVTNETFNIEDTADGLLFSEWVDDIKTLMANYDIPEHASIERIENGHVYFSYTRPETIREFNHRVYFKPKYEVFNKKEKKNALLLQKQMLEAELVEIEKQLS